jgi:hypothetical protein
MCWAASSLNGIANVAKNAADLSAQEEQRDDRHDCDKGEDECVLGETLAGLVEGQFAEQILDHLGTMSFHFASVSAEKQKSRQLNGEMRQKYYHVRNGIPILCVPACTALRWIAGALGTWVRSGVVLRQ